MELQSFLAQIASDPFLPTPPALAMQVIHKASRPDCALSEIAALVSRDPALCARVLKLVNSAFFSVPRAITSIDRAMSLLGLRRVRSLVLGLSLPSVQRRWQAHPWMRDFWKASVASAIAAHEWATLNRSVEPDDDLVSSLLCDLGTLVLLEAFPNKYAEILRLSPDEFVRRQCEMEQSLFGFDHAEISAHLLASWGFPEEMTEAIRFHHRPEAARGKPGAIAQRAQTLSFASKIGQLQLAPEHPELLLELIKVARDRYNLDQQQFTSFLEPLEAKVEELASLLNVDIGTFYHYPTLLMNAAAQLAQLAQETALDNIRVSQEKSKVESDCRRGEEALQQLGRKHELILNAAGEGLYGLDIEGKITFANAAASRLLGWPTEELIGLSAKVMLGPKGAPYSAEPWVFHQLAASPHEDTVQVEDSTFWRKDGSNFPVAYTCAPIREAGELVGAVMTFRDMTQHRKLEEQFRQANKMEAVGRLAGGVAHDFNNLLTVILGCGELLMMPGMIPEPGRRLVAEITKAGKQAADLTRQLLAFSRQQMLEPKVLNLNDVISDVEKLLRRLIGEDITLASSLTPSLGRIKADPGQLEQVILNLAVNARDAMPTGGRLLFETSNVDLRSGVGPLRSEVTPGKYVSLAVTDTGCGMDASTQAQIFEPFFTTKGLGKGTGLGLATVYGIVKQSGGFIEVTSKVGVGTCFAIYLPRVEDEEDRRRLLHEFEEKPFGQETVLVVEDEKSVRDLILHSLQECGYTVLEASHGREGLEVCSNHKGPIHLLLSDVVMPQMGGSALAENVLQARPDTKVLFMSGYTDDAVVHHGVLNAKRPFLQKPFTPSGLAAKVREVLDTRPLSPSSRW